MQNPACHHPDRLRRLRHWAAAGLLAGLAVLQPVLAAPPAAGTQIENTASGTFVDSGSGLSVRVESNTVSVFVQPIEICTLTPGQTVVRAPGTNFALPHLLTNNGNVAETCDLDLQLVAGATFTPTGVEVIEDLSGTGVPEPGDPILFQGTGATLGLPPGVTINPGASVALLVIGTVPGGPGGAVPGESATLRLDATSAVQRQHTSSLDTVIDNTGPSLSVTKSASTPNPVQNGTITYTLAETNIGNFAALGTTVSVDGNNQNLVVLRDAIPANTTYVSLGTAGSAVQLFHILGQPINTYVSAPPNGVAIDGVGWGQPILAAGASVTGQFTVKVNANAAGDIDNVGYADFQNGGLITVPSNPVQLPLPTLPATISYFPNNGYVAPIQQTSLGVPLYVQINASACNLNASQIESYPVRFNSKLGSDIETFTAVETGPNTGVFRVVPDVPTADARNQPVVTGDGVLELFPNDTVTATLIGCAAAGQIQAIILIDPSGVVFDSKTNQPVGGTTVSLIDVTGGGNGGHAGGPATVFQGDGVTPASNVVSTGADGVFVFPFVLPSTYEFRVSPPAGFLFPSKLPPALQPAGRNVVEPGSYGGTFQATTSGPVRVDIPVDPGATGNMIVQKTASKTAAEVGDFVDYTITVSNNSGIVLNNVVVTDWLPPGFEYVRGSARLGGLALADPLRSGGALQFGLGSLATGAQAVLTYRVAIGPGGQSGNGVNSARAQSGALVSNLATVAVQVLGGVFDNHAVLIGKVFADCNGNRVQDPGEPGIPGVRIWLADGTYAVTDGDGKYSLYGLTPRTTVAAVDPLTLPPGTRLEVLDHRNAMDPSSQFVDLKNGELHKTDFAISQCGPDLDAVIKARKKALNAPDEITQIGKNLLSTSSEAPISMDARSLPASGTIGPNGAIPDGSTTPLRGNALGAVGDTGGSIIQQWPSSRPVFPDQNTTPATSGTVPLAPLYVEPGQSSGANAGAAAATAAPLSAATPSSAETSASGSTPAAVAMPAPLQDLVGKLDPTVGFIDPVDQQTLATAQTRIRVKGPAGTSLRLNVNGQAIDETRVGTRSTVASHGVTAWEYIGVDLKPGPNTLTVSAVDSFGVERGKASISVRAPGNLAKLHIVLPDKAVADTQTPVKVSIEALDASGLPVTSRLPVNLQTSLGIWQEKGSDTNEPGLQVFIEGGRGTFMLLPPAHPGMATINAKSGNVETEEKLTFTPFLRPMMAVGLVEGVLDLRKLDPHSVQSLDGTEGFEQQIASVSRSFDQGKDDAALRTQVFLKGKVLGSTLLTLGYDSDKPSDTALFRDIQPTQFYPVYGDSSVKGFDAQSTGKLYVRLDHGTSYLLLGDFSSQTDNPARQLTQYTRALNGLKGHGNDGRFTVDSFASHTSSTQVVVEIPGNGTSGPYPIDERGVVNSQQVDLIVRDRTQPNVIVTDTPLTPFVDYTIEPLSGELLFANPVPAVDPNLNPVFIRINYEVEEGGPRHWVGGLAGEMQVTKSFAFGLSGVRDEDPANRLDLYGMDFTAHLGTASTLVGEFARSDTAADGIGDAERLEWRGQTDRVQGRIWAIRTGPDFQNPSALESAGAGQYGAQVGIKIDAKDRIVIEGLRTIASTNLPLSSSSSLQPNATPPPAASGSQTGASASLQHNFSHDVKLTVGVRHADGEAQTSIPQSNGSLPNTTPVDFTSGFVRLDAPMPYLPKAAVFAQYERAFNESAQDVSFGGTYSLGNLGKLYLRHDTSDSLSGAFGLSPNVNQYSTVFGLQTDLADHTALFNEYRIGEGIDGRAAEDAVGLRHLWQLEPGLGVSATAERITPMSGEVTDQSQALTAAISDTMSEVWKSSARVEWRESQQSQSWLTTGATAFKLGPDWTLLGRAYYNEVEDRDGSTGTQHLGEVQTGFAFRPAQTDIWNALGLIGYKRDQDSTQPVGQQVDENEWILLTQVEVQPSARWDITTRLAAKYADDNSNGIHSDGWTELIGARVTRDFGERWDGGLQAYTSWGLGNRRDAAGLEVGYLVRRNFWLSAGYNVVGFYDPDLSGGAYTQDGFYLRLRLKFGADLFDPVGDMSASHNDRPVAAENIWNSPENTAHGP